MISYFGRVTIEDVRLEGRTFYSIAAPDDLTQDERIEFLLMLNRLINAISAMGATEFPLICPEWVRAGMQEIMRQNNRMSEIVTERVN